MRKPNVFSCSFLELSVLMFFVFDSSSNVLTSAPICYSHDTGGSSDLVTSVYPCFCDTQYDSVLSQCLCTSVPICKKIISGIKAQVSLVSYSMSPKLIVCLRDCLFNKESDESLFGKTFHVSWCFADYQLVSCLVSLLYRVVVVSREMGPTRRFVPFAEFDATSNQTSVALSGSRCC